MVANIFLAPPLVFALNIFPSITFLGRESCLRNWTRNSSGDEIANVNFLYDDIVHGYGRNDADKELLFPEPWGLEISGTVVQGISLSTCTVCILSVLMCWICTTTSDVNSTMRYGPNHNCVSFRFCCRSKASASTTKLHCVPKSDAKIKITITTAHLIRINYPLSSFNYRLSGTHFANFNKIHHMVSEQQL